MPEPRRAKYDLEERRSILDWIRPYVRQCGDQRRPPWKLEDRCLLDFLLVYIAEGTGLFVIDGVRYDVAPGELYWIPPRTVHHMEGYPPSMPDQSSVVTEEEVDRIVDYLMTLD